jgi:hypothetical protein
MARSARHSPCCVFVQFGAVSGPAQSRGPSLHSTSRPSAAAYVRVHGHFPNNIPNDSSTKKLYLRSVRACHPGRTRYEAGEGSMRASPCEPSQAQVEASQRFRRPRPWFFAQCGTENHRSDWPIPCVGDRGAARCWERCSEGGGSWSVCSDQQRLLFGGSPAEFWADRDCTHLGRPRRSDSAWLRLIRPLEGRGTRSGRYRDGLSRIGTARTDRVLATVLAIQALVQCQLGKRHVSKALAKSCVGDRGASRVVSAAATGR